MDRFQNGEIQFLISTEVLCRGVQGKDVAAVINYNLKRDWNGQNIDYTSYLHRTGRANRNGKLLQYTISFLHILLTGNWHFNQYIDEYIYFSHTQENVRLLFHFWATRNWLEK